MNILIPFISIIVFSIIIFTMSSRPIRIIVRYDTKKTMDKLDSGKKKVDDFKKVSEQTIRGVMTNIRKSAQIGITAYEAIFGAMSAVTRYAIEGSLQIGELFTTVLAAQGAISPFLAFRAGVQIASVIAIFIQVNRLRRDDAQRAQEAGRWAIFFRSLGTY